MDTNFPERRKQLEALLAQMGNTLPGPLGGFPACTRSRLPKARSAPRPRSSSPWVSASPSGATGAFRFTFMMR